MHTACRTFTTRAMSSPIPVRVVSREGTIFLSTLVLVIMTWHSQSEQTDRSVHSHLPIGEASDEPQLLSIVTVEKEHTLLLSLGS